MMRHQNLPTCSHAIYLQIILLHILMVIATLSELRLTMIVAVGMFACKCLPPGAGAGEMTTEGTECFLQKGP
jgi:hypothetical protein